MAKTLEYFGKVIYGDLVTELYKTIICLLHFKNIKTLSINTNRVDKNLNCILLILNITKKTNM